MKSIIIAGLLLFSSTIFAKCEQLIENMKDGESVKKAMNCINERPSHGELITYQLWRSDVDRHPAPLIYIGCGDPTKWAITMCYSGIEVKTIRTQAGGQCGHTLYEVKCYPKLKQ